MNAFPRWLALMMLAVLLGLASIGAGFYHVQRRYVQAHVEADLASIAQMKAEQIAQWRRERLGDAEVLSGSPFFAREVSSWLLHQRPELEAGLLTRMRLFVRSYGYCDVLLLDPGGEVLLSASGRHGRVDAAAFPFVQEALREGRAALTDLHLGELDENPHVSALAPLFAEDGAERRPIALVALVVDASRFLYPLIQSWPTHTETAETLLVRPDGESVVFLNELRHMTNTALNLRIPMTRSDVPAVMAVRGQTGVVYGVDYRGVPVVSVLRPVPGSGWFMVSKMDEAEAFAAWRFRSLMILCLLLLALLAAIGGVGMVWLRRSREYYAELYRAEAERHEAEARYRTTLLSVGDAVISTSADGRVDLLNPVAEKLTGWRQEEAAGRLLAEVFHIINEDTRLVVESPVERVIREGVVVGLANHTLLVSKDGREIPIADAGAPIRDERGVICGVVLVFRDQTAERQAARALERETANLRAVVDSSPVGLMVLDAEERVVIANPAAERLFRKRLDELASRRCGDLLGCVNRHRDPRGCGYSEDCPSCALFSAVRKVLVDGVPVLGVEAETRLESSHGPVTCWLRVGAEPLLLDGRRHAVLALDDITERKQAEEEVRRLMEQGERDRRALLGILEDQRRSELELRAASEKRRELEAIINRSPAVAFLWKADEGWPVEYVSESVRQFGLDPEDLRAGRLSYASLIHPDDLKRVTDEVAAYSRDPRLGEYVQEYRLVLPDGRVVWVDDRTWLRRNERGTITHYQGVVLDITDRKEAELEILRLNETLEQRVRERTAQLEAANKELESFSYSVSHDLRAPLRSIDGFSQAVMEECEKTLPTGSLDNLRRVRLAAQQMSRLIDGMLGLARLTRREMRVREVDLSAMADDVLQALRLADPARHVRAVVARGLKAGGDPDMMKLVVQNLLENAWKFTRDAKDPEIEVGRLEQDGGPVFFVRDNGAGFDPAYAGKLFGAFQRLHTEAQFQGTGLGLASVHRILLRHGGRIWAEGVVGKGATFFFTLWGMGQGGGA